MTPEEEAEEFGPEPIATGNGEQLAEMVQMGDDLTGSQWQELKALNYAFRDVFSEEPGLARE